MINILFIAYEFAPNNTGGTFRSIYMVKYLKQFGINPIVLTLDPDSYSKVYADFVIDKGLLGVVPKDIDVRPVASGNTMEQSLGIRSFFTNFQSNLYAGNEACKWEKSFLREAEKVCLQYDLKAVYVTMPPFSMLRTGSMIAKKLKLPLILDFRDPWFMWRTNPFSSFFHYWYTKHLEAKHLQSADAIIATSDQTIIDFMHFHPQIDRKRFHLIPNGYDGEMEAWALKMPEKEKEDIVIGYVGSFYYNPEARTQLMTPWYKKKLFRILQYSPTREDWRYRSPWYFFAAIKRLLELRPDFRKRIQLKFIGSIPDWLPAMMEEFGLSEYCSLLGQKNAMESIAFQNQCDYLLITSSKIVNGDTYSIAGKTFEYFSIRKPILAFVASGAQKRIILNSGMGLICDPDNIDESAKRLITFFEHNIELTPNKQFLNSLNRKNLAKQLAGVIHKVCA